MKRSATSSLLLSVLLVTFCFGLVLIFCRPVLNSDDDLYVLYTLSGGYGNKPTHLLHYLYVWHPFLFFPVAKLFTWFPSVNWYSLFYLLLQAIACVQLSGVLLLLFPRAKAVLVFALFFLFVETGLLLSLNNSNTSLLLGISGGISLLAGGLTENRPWRRKKELGMAAALLLLSGLLRMHILGFCMVLTTVVACMLLPFPALKKLIGKFVWIGSLSLLLLGAQYTYYTTQIRGYQTEEAYRNAVFKTANYPVNPVGHDTGVAAIKASFIQSLFLFDSSFVSIKDIDRYLETHARTAFSPVQGSQSQVYWLVMNLRVHLIFLLLTGCMLFVLTGLKTTARWLVIAAFCAVAFALFYLFLKTTLWLFLGFAAFLFLSAVLLSRHATEQPSTLQPWIFVLFFLNVCWMMKRIKSTNDNNLSDIQQTHAILNELKKNSHQLFVNTTYFNDRGFSIWDRPKDFPLTNFVNIGNVLTGTSQASFQRFGVDSVLKAIPVNPHIRVSGRMLPALKMFYRDVYGWKVEVQKIDSFRSLDVYRVEKIGD